MAWAASSPSSAALGLGAGGRGDRDKLEGDAVEAGQLFRVAMVGDDERDFALELAGAPALEQVGHAMQVLRAEERDAGLVSGCELPAHAELYRKGREGRLEGFKIKSVEAVERPLDAHEEEALFVVLVLVCVENIGAALIEQAGDTGNQAFAIRAVDEKNGGSGHALPSLLHHLRSGSHLRSGRRSLSARMGFGGLPPIRGGREWMGHICEFVLESASCRAWGRRLEAALRADSWTGCEYR